MVYLKYLNGLHRKRRKKIASGNMSYLVQFSAPFITPFPPSLLLREAGRQSSVLLARGNLELFN